MPNVGTNWAGSYSRFTFDESKQYFMMLKEQGVPVLDDEFNVAQDMILTMVRRFIQDTMGDGSPNNGFKIVGTGATNDFTITGGNGTLDGAGHLYVAGWMLLLQSDVTYLTQPIAQSALTTPGSARNDEVYVDIYVDEIGPIADAVMKDPTLNIETSRRLKLFWQVKVAQGATTPASYTDANSRKHSTYKLATIYRTTSPTIQASMVGDSRKPFVDARLSVFQRIAGAFAPHEQNIPDMTVRVDAGPLISGGIITEQVAQNAGGGTPIVAPTTNPRFDRIVVDAQSGFATVLTGVEAGSPNPPVIPVGKLPIARVLLQTSSTVITNSMLADERTPVLGMPAFRGALVTSSTGQSLTGTSFENYMLFNVEQYDTDNIHSLVANTDRLTVPAGVSKVRLNAVLGLDLPINVQYLFAIYKNGLYNSSVPRLYTAGVAPNPYASYGSISSPVLNVTPGDYFSLIGRYTSSGIQVSVPYESYFSMEIIE